MFDNTTKYFKFDMRLYRLRRPPLYVSIIILLLRYLLWRLNPKKPNALANQYKWVHQSMMTLQQRVRQQFYLHWSETEPIDSCRHRRLGIELRGSAPQRQETIALTARSSSERSPQYKWRFYFWILINMVDVFTLGEKLVWHSGSLPSVLVHTWARYNAQLQRTIL
jgi:hypothetical protein